MPSEDDVALWMKDKVDSVGVLDQDFAVYQIKRQFGDAFVYQNESGNLAINKSVLRKFKKLTEADVVWSRGDKAWRKRHKFDSAGRQQD